MRQRNPGRSSSSQSRSHARNDLERNVVSAQGFDLFPGASEDQRIATLQPDDAQSGGGQRHHETIDLSLLDFLFSAALAYVVIWAVDGISCRISGATRSSCKTASA